MPRVVHGDDVMEKKKPQIVGHRRITSMTAWDRDFVDEVNEEVSDCLKFSFDGMDEMRYNSRSGFSGR